MKFNVLWVHHQVTWRSLYLDLVSFVVDCLISSSYCPQARCAISLLVFSQVWHMFIVYTRQCLCGDSRVLQLHMKQLHSSLGSDAFAACEVPNRFRWIWYNEILGALRYRCLIWCFVLMCFSREFSASLLTCCAAWAIFYIRWHGANIQRKVARAIWCLIW